MKIELKLKDGNIILALNVVDAAKQLFGGKPFVSAKIDILTCASAGWCEAGTIETNGEAYDYYKTHEKYVFMSA